VNGIKATKKKGVRDEWLMENQNSPIGLGTIGIGPIN